MIHFHYFESEPRYIFLSGDSADDTKSMTMLETHINKVPEFCYMPQFHGIPYREEFLFNRTNKEGKKVWYCAVGLWQEIYKFFRKHSIEFDGLKPEYFKRETCTLDEFKEVVRSWGLKFEPRPYQYEAAWKTLQWKQSLSELCTRAGKTLIAYMIFRYMMECEGVKKILMIVPSVSLVKQGYNDFADYAEFFHTEVIWGGAKKNDMVDSPNLCIGTYQSLIKKLDRHDKKFNPKWFDQFDLVFVDEVHGAKASQTKTIITQPFFSKCKLVYGMTGTLPKENTIDRFTLASLLGAKIHEIRAEELQDAGYISDIMIHQIKIDYDQNDQLTEYYIQAGEYIMSDYVYEQNGRQKKKVPLENPEFLWKHKKELPPGIELTKQKLHDNTAYAEYLRDLIKASDSSNFLQLERMVLHKLTARVDILKELIFEKINDTGNWLILTHHTEYTEYVAQELQNAFGDKKNIFTIKGSVTQKKREKIMKDMKPGNAILVASYGCMSTGITLPDLRYGVLFESFKSNTVNVQSLGRGLGKSEGKDVYEVWDFVDMLPTKKIIGQGKEREKIYKEQAYPYDIKKVRGIV